MSKLTTLPEWQALAQQVRELPTLSNLLQHHPQRTKQYQLSVAGIALNYSQVRADETTLKLLIALAEARQLNQAIDDLFNGKPVNTSEKRPALHTALREQNPRLVRPEVRQALADMFELVEQVANGKWRGYSGEKITDIVNIGIGGSDLGPRMVVTALKDYQQQLRCHFVANVDADDLQDVLAKVKPQTTLFIVTSKTFTTIETLTNAQSAHQWLQQSTQAIGKHFVAVTANVAKAREFGISEANIFPMWDWVGGRYSLWSAVGLPIVFAIGVKNFQLLLQGAYALDQHFRQAEFRENMPVLMALFDILNINFFQAKTLAILPYSHRLRLLPNYLQQLLMESNGKSVAKAGGTVDYSTGAIIWGGVETNGQHAFHQLLFQGTHFIPCDFILVKNSQYHWQSHHRLLLANGKAQMQALLQGRKTAEPYQTIPGDKPCCALWLEQLNPQTLGALIAFYEHRAYVQSVIWDINAFDQWGVELGKMLAKELIE